MVPELEETTDETETTSTDATAAPGSDPGSGVAEDGEQAPSGGAEGGEPDDDGEDIKALPEWARRTIRGLRKENATRRTALREAEDRLSKAATVEELEAARSEWQKEREVLEAQLTRERVLRKVNLPDELAERLKGASYDEMLEDAQSLAALVRKPGRGGKGGLDPSERRKQDDDDDPVEIARKVRAARRGHYYN